MLKYICITKMCVLCSLNTLKKFISVNTFQPHITVSYNTPMDAETSSLPIFFIAGGCSVQGSLLSFFNFLLLGIIEFSSDL